MILRVSRMLNPGGKNTHFLSSIADLNSITLISGVFVLPDIVYHMVYYNPVTHSVPQTPPVLFYIMNLGLCLVYCKDCIGAQSLGKRFFKLQVISLKTGAAATPMQCLIRNFSLVLLPVEIIMILINPSRRIGDILAGTKLENIGDAKKTQVLNYPQIVSALIVSYLLTLFSYTWWFCK